MNRTTLYDALTMRIVKKILLIAGSVIAGLIGLTLICLLILPMIVSSPTAKNRLEIMLAQQLDHALTIEDMKWSWRKGISISGVRLMDHPDFSDDVLAEIRGIDLNIGWGLLLRKKLVFDIHIHGPRLQMIRTADGRTNIVDGFVKTAPAKTPETVKEPSEDAPLIPESPSEKPKPAAKKTDADAPVVLPIDIIGKFTLTDLYVSLDDRQAARHVAVTDAGLRLDVPSLKNKPVSLALFADLSIDHTPVPRSTIAVELSGLFDDAGRLDTRGVAGAIDINLPGLAAEIAGDMKDAGIRGDIHLDLETLSSTAALFIPDISQKMRPTGMIHLVADASGTAETPVAFDIRISGENLGFSGSVIENRVLRDGSIGIHVAGSYDLNHANLAIDTGQIRLLENSVLEISGKMENLTSENPWADLTVETVDIHIDEGVNFLVDFVPEIIKLSGKKRPSMLSVRKFGFFGGLKSGGSRVCCDAIRLDLPQVRITPAGSPSLLYVTGGRLEIGDIETELENFFPVSARLAIALRAETIDLAAGDRMVSIEKLDINQLKVHADDLRVIPDSPLGVAGVFSLNQSLHAGAVSASPEFFVEQLQQFLGITAALDPNGGVKATLQGIGLNASRLTTAVADKKPLSLSCRISASLSEFVMPTINPLTLDLSGFTAELAIDDLLNFSVNADVSDTGRSLIRGRANLRADAGGLAEKFKEFIPPPIKGSGVLDLDLTIDGRMPDESALGRLNNLELTGNLDFLKALALTLQIPEGRLELGLGENNHLTVSEISGTPLLSYTLKGSGGDGRLACKWRMAGIKGIPGLKADSPLSIDLAIDADHRFLSAIDLKQSLRIEPAGIRQDAALSVDGLDGLLASGNINNPYAALTMINAAATAGVDVDDLSRIADMGVAAMPSIEMSGSVSARAGIELIGGSRIGGDARIDISRADINLKDMATVTAAEADLAWFKVYRMAILDPDSPKQLLRSDLLSQQVLEPETLVGRRFRSSGDDFYRHVKQSKERTSPTSEISIGAVSLRKGALPLNLGPSRIVMDVVNGLPGINYFQFDLLGGAINGAVNLRKDDGNFSLRSTLNFSGINTAAFFPELYSGKDDPRAEIRGVIFVDLPVTHRLTEMLENMSVTMEFTKIGSRAIERLLYALDPHESNEAVMAQRRILKNGSPRWVRLDIREGFLSIRGEVTVRNINIALPAIQRLNIARLPGIEKYASAVAPVEDIVRLLTRLSAETLVVSSDGRVIMFE